MTVGMAEGYVAVARPRVRSRAGRLGARVARSAALALVGLAVANCAGPAQMSGKRGNKYGVAASPRVIPDGEPIPKGGGREMVGKPYVVGGQTFVPHDGKGYNREGWASWYGSAFHGRLTANGEVFDRQSVAAAHPTLPLPSYVRVTNVVNKRSMIVRVNDRGPYERERLIDVSEQVAVALDFRRKGTSRVKVEYLGKASTNGSDDAKLLATLRTDGELALFGRNRPATMLADLREEPRVRPSRLPPVDEDDGAEPPAPVRVADAPVRPIPSEPAMPASETDGEMEPPVPPRRPVLAAAAPSFQTRGLVATDDDAQPIPPGRPHLAGVY